VRTIDGLLYCNDGDWVESLTALVETLDGELKIVTWNRILAPGQPVLRWNDHDDEETAALADAENDGKKDAETDKQKAEALPA